MSHEDAYERAEAGPGGVIIQARTRAYYADRDIGSTVYLKHRDEPLAGQVKAIIVEAGVVRYSVRWGNDHEDCYWPFELQDDPEL